VKGSAALLGFNDDFKAGNQKEQQNGGGMCPPDSQSFNSGLLLV
jgi:hypothetical protein